MNLSNNYVLVERYDEPAKEGFQTVDVQDSFVYKGTITLVPDSQPVYLGDRQLKAGDVVLFAKYSPDTHQLEIEGKELKFVHTRDLLAAL